MNETPKSFCPKCQAIWDQPRYDVCPKCGRSFEPETKRNSGWVPLILLCLPAICIFNLKLLPAILLSAFGIDRPGDIAAGLALIGSAVVAVPAGILMACRSSRNPGAQIFRSLLFIPLVMIGSFAMCFFACTVLKYD